MKKITKPGVYKGLSYEEYDAIPALRSTYLKKHLHSPAMTQEPDERTTSLEFGIAGHCYILEGVKNFESRYVVMQKFEGDKRTAPYKELKKSTVALAEAQSKQIVEFEDYESIVGMNKNILKHPTAKLFIGNHEPELTVVWKDKETGLLLKARFDANPNNPKLNIKVIPDLKSTVDCSEHGFRNEIIKYKYYLSAAMYLEGASIALKEIINRFVFIAAEWKRPYKVEVHELSERYLEEANAVFHTTLRKEKECQESGIYPAWLNAGVILQEKPFSLIAEG